MWLLREKFPLVQKLTALDVTKDKQYGIAGVIQNNKPMILLFTFNSSIKLVASVSLNCTAYELQDGITGIKVSPSGLNFIYVSTNTKLHIFLVQSHPETN
jgi:hypothetical protein